MAPVEGGRQCARCDRRLVDFRAASDDQIARAHAESEAPVCGAYSPEQVARWAGPRPILVSLTLGASLLGAAAAAQAEPPSAVHAELSANAARLDQDTLVVRGVVRDSAGAPLSGVVVSVEGTPVRAITDPAGRYTVRVPGPRDEAAPVRLRFGLIGYAGREVEVGVAPDGPAVADVVMTREVLYLEGIMVTGIGHRNLWHRVMDWVRGIF